MTTRDSRSRPSTRPGSGREGARDPTGSLSLERDREDSDAEPSHPSLAIGTNDSPQTRVESPSGRNLRRPATKPPPHRSGDEPEAWLGAVLGTYRLGELLGMGGMGYVYRAEHVKLGREVALKLLRGDYARRRDAVLRFFQEAKTVNRVRHRNIVDVTDFVELEDGTTFIIMELLRGQSLGKLARTGIELLRALDVLMQICDGLAAAHAVGVVHRDLKPDNVIVVPTNDGADLVKLLDFGVAKLVNRDDEDIGFQTAAGSVIGTPAYMSPEQAGGMVVDHRSDIYSLGAIMYELFTGQPMFSGRSFGEYVRKHLTEMPMPPRSTPGGAHLDVHLEALILRCVAKDPNERFNHILELRDGLLHVLGDVATHLPGFASLARPLQTTPLRPHTVPPPPAMVTTVPTPAQPAPSAPHLRPSLRYSHHRVEPATSTQPAPTPIGRWILGAALAIGGGVTCALWYAGSSGSEPSPQPPTAAPTAAPAAPPVVTVPTKPRLVELRFDSLPAAGVFADGHSVELCHTPCSYTFDVKDGPKRAFVIRADGYRDKSLDVDLESDTRELSVTLERLEPDTASSKSADPGGITHSGKRPTKPAGTKPGAHTPVPIKSVETKPPEKGVKIDPSDTHDPFHRHR